MHENSHPRFQLPAGQSHVKSGSATPQRPLSSPPGHVEPWSRVAVAVISVLRCHRRTPPRTAVSTSALHVGPSADRSLARSCRGAPCSPWGEDPVGRGASIPTDGRACSGCACRALAEPAGPPQCWPPCPQAPPRAPPLLVHPWAPAPHHAHTRPRTDSWGACRGAHATGTPGCRRHVSALPPSSWPVSFPRAVRCTHLARKSGARLRCTLVHTAPRPVRPSDPSPSSLRVLRGGRWAMLRAPGPRPSTLSAIFGADPASP